MKWIVKIRERRPVVPPAEAQPDDIVGGRWMLARLFVGSVAGALIGYALAIIGGATGPEATDAAFWVGVAGYCVGGIATVDVRNGRLFWDRAAFSATWGKEGWERGIRHLEQQWSVLKWLIFSMGLLAIMIAMLLIFEPKSPGDAAQAPWVAAGGILLLCAPGLGVFREKLVALVSTAGAGLGTTLIVVGTGIIALLFPSVLRFAFQNDASLNVSAQVLVGIAAMMVVGGCFLRRR